MLLPPAVLAKARLAGADDWVDGLPDLVRSLERDWGLRVGEVFTDASEALVVAVTCEDGSQAVLKVVVPRAGGHAASEAAVLGAADGSGMARLLRSDPERDALLMERLGPSLHDLGLPRPVRQDLLCDLASRVWRPVGDLALTTGAEKARWLVEYVTTTWEQLDRPCDERAVQHALDCARRRGLAHDEERAVLVHGDVHEWNALLVPGRDAADGADSFRLVDPDGLRAEPEYDLGVILREDVDDLLVGDPRERSRRLAARTGTDETAVWEWGVAERVSTGLVCVSIGLDVGRAMLRTAEHLARGG